MDDEEYKNRPACCGQKMSLEAAGKEYDELWYECLICGETQDLF